MPLEVGFVMTPAPLAATFVICSEVGIIGNVVVWNLFTQSWTILLVDLIRLGAFMCPPCSLSFIGLETWAYPGRWGHHHRRSHHRRVDFVYMPSFGKRRRDGRLARRGHGAATLDLSSAGSIRIP